MKMTKEEKRIKQAKDIKRVNVGIGKVVAWFKADKGKKFFKRRWFQALVILIALNVAFGDKEEVKVEKVASDIKVFEKAKEEVPKVVLTPEQIKANAISDAKAKKIADHKIWVESQFSLFSGEHRDLVKLIKNNLNDAKSFEHVETTYKDFDTYLIIKMTYRAKNAYGGLILQNVTAKADKVTNTITVTSQNN